MCIRDRVEEVERSYIDGTFYSETELPNRSIEEIPHPLIEESIQKFIKMPDKVRDSIHFIHLNHTNQALRKGTEARRYLNSSGMHVAKEFDIFRL